MKETLISGIQPTGKLHIGNYLGALKNFVALQNSEKYKCFFFIADLHALTENPEPKALQNNIIDLAATFLAIGLDPKKSTLFIQSQILFHTELMWILNTLVPPGELFRMTQFKEKAEIVSNAGLLNYPLLMAADILIYNPQFVPVGHDQLQHLELARTLARKFNAKFSKTFLEPKSLLTLTPRIMSLDNPEKKMSKSLPAGCLFIDDDPKTMREKIMHAVTDSGKKIKYDEKNKPAISNLINIYAVLFNTNKNIKHQTSYIEHLYKGKGYADFKKDLAKIVIDYFAPFQKKKRAIATHYSLLTTAFASGAKIANTIASQRILEIKKKVGLIV